ncbi:phytoene desaturase (lycopene-forming) [Oxobacter pfennigii]|uniref:Phytoene desaturase (Lycopene-forming) n=1 Tax=Oxobacter pfennigii TaxID=36849 RepID=A0A0P8WCN5_9CLOT|nr:NAD(P)/FAD-dependent oxidoreductase [Oxobacter pfennigii]KPU45522.1 phytoene desaturase (lycopene-forming) [Oxobacter pfennigii]
MSKSIIIIGAGMGGMAAGVYGQMNGFKTRIYEMHHLPGGQCTSWKRKGYTFDVCIHHLMGCSQKTGINRIWGELGAMPRELVYTKEMVSVVSPEGKMFCDYYDPDLLSQHLKEISPDDSKVIDEYINGIKTFGGVDLWGSMMLGNILDIVKIMPKVLKTLKWFKPTMADFAQRFKNPFLRKAFPLLVYSMPEAPFAVHLARHGSGYAKDIAWPVGASAEFAASIAKHYEKLGGKIYYQKKVARILTQNSKAVGVEFLDGSREYADIVISNADGRKTLQDLLEGKYLDKKLEEYCKEPKGETNWAVHVFLGVDRDLSNEPSSLVMLLDQPVIIAGHEHHSLEMQLYGFDKTMAPDNKGVIKAELVGSYSYWKELASDKALYDAEKEKVASQVIDILEGYFHGIKDQVEVVDVPTLLTWERFMGGTHGFANIPNKKADIIGSLFKNEEMLVPGLDNFYFVGAWSTSAGALFVNALSGKKAIQYICKKERQKFIINKV